MNKRLKTYLSLMLALSVFMASVSCSNKTTSEKDNSDETEEVTTTVDNEDTDASTSESESTKATETEPEVEVIPTVNPEYVGKTPEEIVSMMTLEEKASQMMEGAIYELPYADMEKYCYGSVLSTFGNWPATSASGWIEIITEYQKAALSSEAGIPFIYGQDAVHGINTASGCVIFPHNINIGAANDPELTHEYGVVVGSDLWYTGMIWNFAPCVAASQDPRWGRTYESYSSDTEIIKNLSVAYTEGLLEEGIIVCPKHFICEGYVQYGSGEVSGGVDRIIDRGDAIVSDEVLEENLAIYQALIDAGVQTIMPSHSALNGIKMHEHSELISYLKNEMGFDGMIISDWDSIENCSGSDLHENVVICVNAGIDMFMEASNFEECRDIIIDAVNNGEISMDRIDDAVTRIIRVKMEAGLFEDPYLENADPTYEYNSDYEKEVATKLAQESFVPLKTDAGLTIEPGSRVFVMGPAADDSGALCGGWTVTWEGMTDQEAGTKFIYNSETILEALENKAEEYDVTIVTDPSEIDTCDLIVLCVGERTYAEWTGDTEDLSITGSHGMDGNLEAIEMAKEANIPTMTLIVAGRNVIISDYINDWDSVIMCYLPGSMGGVAVANALFGECEYQGKLPMPYYRSVSDIEKGNVWLPVGYSAN